VKLFKELKSIESAKARGCSTEAINLVCLIVEVVVIGKFFTSFNGSVSAYDNVLLLLHIYNFS